MSTPHHACPPSSSADFRTNKASIKELPLFIASTHPTLSCRIASGAESILNVRLNNKAMRAHGKLRMLSGVNGFKGTPVVLSPLAISTTVVLWDTDAEEFRPKR